MLPTPQRPGNLPEKISGLITGLHRRCVLWSRGLAELVLRVGARPAPRPLRANVLSPLKTFASIETNNYLL
ncbi:hypothetical protein J6590_051140 [Homalodisca vitripennis]|nr:hypothetical protein J6590_051140 [Homalodisca vitripennis]